ncbi:uncharacterized protein N7503_000772 [Penicillium pulvis]|uniref:uncharacterized protein n=1 Tax=Penicillium pulvis TaxID=1562058 RepID=UPI002546FA06|nr:uncharacterized protein N7503_000772 [Penicillium pulvis]KAJ5814022.1 hypothetical protein N7503_000772 [Penicillium pulvis]
MDNIRLYTAQSRPDLWEILKSPSHPLNAAWPTFIDQDKYFQHYCSQLDRFEAFAPMQYAIVDVDTHGGEHIIACGRSVPFYWPELDRIGGKRGLRQHPEILHSLPDEGYDGILSRAFEQQLAREGIAQDMNGLRPISDPARTRTEAPNALSAISITVSPQYRSQGLADLLIMAMKQTALDQGYDALVVPLRPTRKSDYPRTEMADYLSWLATPNPDYGVSKMKAKSTDPSLPFDPWLRKHVRLGARVVKVARRSMYVEGSAQDWQQWTGVNFSQLIGRKDTPLKQEANSGKLYLEAVFPKGLVPLRYYLDEQRCVYLEPNIWLYHELPL